MDVPTADELALLDPTDDIMLEEAAGMLETDVAGAVLVVALESPT